ncbi:MAG: acyl-ACP--UDP-N-acetylglucosamine O-acyltransferase [Phycisphaerae bacterium]
MSQIHSTAEIEPGAQLAANVVIGPFAYIGPKVILGSGCVVHHHASILGNTVAGKNNQFFPGCVIGGIPQDLKYRGGDCRVVIGDNNHFREMVTVNIGTEDGGGMTQIGSNNLLMVNVHVAHDCFVRDHCVIGNNTMLAGHIEVENNATIDTGVAITHFISVGQFSGIGPVAGVVHDIPPFMYAAGHPAAVQRVNKERLLQFGFTAARITPIEDAYRLLFQDRTPLASGAEKLERLYPGNADIKALLGFVRRAAEGKYGRYRESLRSPGVS